MAVSKCTLYIKGDQSIEVKKRDITLGDLVLMECTEPNIIAKLKTVKVLKVPDEGKHRYVISVLKLIELIHKEYPGLEVQNMGVPDMIVTYEEQKKHNQVWQICKVAFIVLTTFFGSGFAIMTFNNDSATTELFDKIYELVTGTSKNGFSILELSYSIGIVIGILIFFNHFGKRKFSVDPTPMEIEMRLYENDIQTTVISEFSRKGQEIDVGQSTHNGNYRN